MKEVSGATITSESKEALKVNETNKYNVSIATGSDVIFTVTFNDVDDVETFSGNVGNVREISHSYTRPGNYTVCLNASNALSWDAVCITGPTLVQNEIVRDDFVLDHPYAIDLTSSATFSLSILGGKPEPSDVDIEIHYNGSALHSDRIFSWPFSEDITFPEICEGNATIEVLLQNEVSSMTLNSVIILMKPISNGLLIDGPAIWVKNTEASFTTTGAIGTHWECRINWGDMTPVSTVDNNKCDADTIANHTYTDTGTFNISTNCSNLLNTEDAEASVTIKSQPALTLTSNSTIAKPPGMIELTFTAISPMAPMTSAENLLFNITYRNSEAIHGLKMINSEQTISFFMTETIRQTIQDRGVYNIEVSISAAGIEEGVDISTNVTVYEVITGLNITSSATSAFTEKLTPITFTVTMETGSDYLISTTFESGQVQTLTGTYFDDTLRHNYTYTIPGVYSVTTTCTNPVSTQEASTDITVRSKLDLILVVDDAIALQNGLVNITINSNWMMTVGENTTFTVSFSSPDFTPNDISEDTVLFQNTYTYSFTTATVGDYTVTVSAKNGIDTWMNQTQFSVQEEIKSVILDHPYAIDLTSPAAFNLSIPDGKPEPSDVDIEIHYNGSTVHSGHISSWPLSEDVTFPEICEGNATIEVLLQNEVSSLTLNSNIILMNPISNGLLIDGPEIWVKNTQASFTITGAMGTHWECQINWGDTTPISTVDNNMCDANAIANHTYTDTGTFNISTNCSNLLNTEDAQTSVTIKSQPAMTLTSNSTIAKPPGIIELTFTAISPMAPMTSLEDLVFNITYSNPEAIHGLKMINSEQTISFLMTEIIRLTIQDRGVYHIEVSVSAVGIEEGVNISTNVTVYEVITGLNITSSVTSAFAEKLTPVTFTVTMETGSDYSISTTFESGQVQTLTGTYFDDTLRHNYTYITPGVYSVMTTCTNPVSMQEASTDITVQSKLDLILVMDDAITLQNGKVNITINSNWMMAVRENVTFTVSFSSSVFSPNDISEDTVLFQNTYTYSFTTATVGDYTVIVSAKNGIDTWMNQTQFSVQEEIKSVILDHPYVIDLTSPATFNLSIPDGKPEPSDVDIEIHYNGSVVHSGHVVSWPFSEYVTFADICEGNATIEVLLQNEVSSMTLNSVIVLMKPISNGLSINGPAIWVKNTQASFTITGALGTHWACQINWGDRTPISTVNNNMCDANAIANHTYTDTGTFNISNNCSNLLNTENADASVTIKSQPAVTLTSNATISKPPGTIALTFTAVSPMAPMTSAEDLTFNMTLRNPEARRGPKTIVSIRTIRFLTTETVEQTVQDRGTYSVDVLVSALGVEVGVEVSTNVTVYDVITGLGVTSSAPSSFVEKNTPVTFTVNMATGSDYSISTTFESGQMQTLTGTYFNDTLQHSYTFTTPGVYSISTTCTNPVSTQETSTDITVQSQLDLVLVMDDAIALQNGKVNITINSNWMMNVAENVTFNVSFNSPVFSPNGISEDYILFQNTHAYSFTTGTIGEYIVTVGAENGVDAWTSSAKFTVQEEIESLTFTHWSRDNYSDADVTRHLVEEPVYFTATRLTGSGISACAWNFGDGGDILETTSVSAVAHSYAEEGNYDVTYSCTNPIGTKNVTVLVHVGSPVGLDEMLVPTRVYLDDGIAIDVTFKRLVNVCMSFTIRPLDGGGGGEVIRFWKTVGVNNCTCAGGEESVDPTQLEVLQRKLKYK